MYQRDIVGTLIARIAEPRKAIQVVTGPRQTGKTTALQQVAETLETPHHFVKVSQDIINSQVFVRREWEIARRLAQTEGEAVLFIDEIQMVKQWSSVVKALWDEDTFEHLNVKVILSGSSSLLIQKGLKESLAGRFEILHCSQWDYQEMHDAFGYSLDDFLYFGGYPGAVDFIKDNNRWLGYMHNSIIAPSVYRDVVLLDNVHKPALLDALFTLGCAYSGQELSLRKIQAQLDDAGNLATLSEYLTYLSDAELLSGLQKYSDKLLKRRASSPRFTVHDTSLMVSCFGYKRDGLLKDSELRGHLVESAVGAYLLHRSKKEGFGVHWWRENNNEVDFVLTQGDKLAALEVKSGRVKALGGLDAFFEAFPRTRTIVIGSSETTLDDFLRDKIPLF